MKTTLRIVDSNLNSIKYSGAVSVQIDSQQDCLFIIAAVLSENS